MPPTLLLFFLLCAAVLRGEPSRYFGIRATDEATGRGIPLIEFRTVNDIRLVTDNAGWAAIEEPGLMGREVFFKVSGPGYEASKDGFGYAGVRLKLEAGKTQTIKLKRSNIAERIGRLTGQGLYRDSELLRLPCALQNLTNGAVLGQDSVQAMPYRGKIFWLWGDTNCPEYPLGNFHTSCALSAADCTPERGISYDYFMDQKEPMRLRKMLPDSEPGAVWMFGLLTVSEQSGKEELWAGYSRQKGLVPPDERGIARFNEDLGTFEKVTKLDKAEPWRFPTGAAMKGTEEGVNWWYFCAPFPHTRVKATAEAIKDPGAYESFAWDADKRSWRWQKSAPATTQAEERRLLGEGKLPPEQARFQLQDAATGMEVSVHTASVQWNAWRKKWVITALQFGGKDAPSPLGEMWYAEAPSPTGPWRKAVKIASHPRYSYYNPVHHAFLDAEDGRIIYFEGTYTLEFSGNPIAPARYDYNQLCYRLDLADPRLVPAQQ